MKFQVAEWKFQVAECKSQVAEWKFQVAESFLGLAISDLLEVCFCIWFPMAYSF